VFVACLPVGRNCFLGNLFLVKKVSKLIFWRDKPLLMQVCEERKRGTVPIKKLMRVYEERKKGTAPIKK